MNTSELGEDLLLVLQDRGWRIERSASREPLLPVEVARRYPRLPVELTRFLERIESCVNVDENVWFLCRADYRRTDEQGFRWDEFERMSLEAASGDLEWQAQVRSFWNRHFPFMMAVHSDYDYLAVNLEERSYGAVVHGSGPEFEETSIVAASFAQFTTLLRETAAGHSDEYPLSSFL
jgi:hypothetical protein